MNMNQDKNK